MKNKERNSNFELMRIIAMLFIVLWHIYLYGGIKNNPRIINTNIAIIFEFISFILMVHVNSFVILTGYFQSKADFKIKKFFSLLDSMFFYRIIFLILFCSLGIITLTKAEMIDKIFTRDYWFIQVYLVLYLVSPFLNIFIKKIDKKNYQKLLLVLFFILSIIPFITGNKTYVFNDGYNLSNFIYMYLIGGYLRKYPIKESYIFKILSKNLYRLVLVFVFILCFMINYMNTKTFGLLSSSNTVLGLINSNYSHIYNVYSNPFVIIQTISFFLLFESIDFKSKIVNKISSLVLGVYFIHENGFVRTYLYKWLKIDNGIVTSYKFILYVFLMAILIFVCSLIIEFIRQMIFKFIKSRKITKKIENKASIYIRSVRVKESNINE